MEFNELTQEEKVTYLNFMLLIRPLLAKVENNGLFISNIVTSWTAEIAAIHNKLATTAVVPDNTGYPNSADLTVAEINTGLGQLAAILVTRSAATTAVAVKAVGPENILVND